MRGFGFEMAAGAGILCVMAALALPSPAAAQAAEPAPPAAVSPASAIQAGKAPDAPAQPSVLNRTTDDTRASTTRYSKRQKNVVATGAAPAASAAAAAQPAVAGASDTVCHAGCKQPGEIVFVPAQTAVATPPVAQTAEAKPAATTDIACVAGCYSGETVIAGTPSAQSSYMTTGARMPKTKASTSGEWMVKINRERGR